MTTQLLEKLYVWALDYIRCPVIANNYLSSVTAWGSSNLERTWNCVIKLQCQHFVGELVDGYRDELHMWITGGGFQFRWLS